MPRTRDAIVIGAGPAGAATAARLHQHGVRDVLVLERQTFPRDKPCGGGLTGRVERALAALGLRLAVPHCPAPRAVLRFGVFERSVTLPRSVAVIRRVEFDASLVEQVRALGVDIRTGERAAELIPGSDAVRVRTAGGAEYAARVVIGADGVASVVRKHLRAGARAAPLRLFMQEIAAPVPHDLLFDFTPMLARVRGYAWVFPLAGGRANVGVMHYPSTPSGAPQLLAALRATLQRCGIALPARGALGWPVWGFDPRAPVAAPRLLTVGDAAGIDALTGEGIAVALEQAAIAGDAVARALATGDFSFADYRRALRRAPVGRDLLLDRWLAALLYQAGAGWQSWLGLMLLDPSVSAWYAARIAGEPVRRRRLLAAIARHLPLAGARRRAVTELARAINPAAPAAARRAA
jgi:geranylgeranyl reductase family protein